MKKITLGFLYNVRHVYPSPDDPRSQLEADYDDQTSIDWMIKHFKQCGFNSIPIEANEEAYIKLKNNKDKIDLVFNYSLGLNGKDKYAHLPAMLEMLQMPYTGSRPLTQALILDKGKLKYVFAANGIPHLSYQVFQTGKEKINPQLHYPLIVKPSAQGSSAGVGNNSVVHNEKELRERVLFIINLFQQPAIVEPFLTGREFSIGMVGNEPMILPIIEPDYSKLPAKFLPLDSLEVKWIFEEENESNHLVCPAKITPVFKKKLHEIVKKVWDVLEIRDLCRIDIRCDENMNPYVLDVNTPCGLIPPEISTTSYFPMAARKVGIEYNDLLKMVVKSALERYK